MRIDGRRCLVTGGAGFIGSNLVDALVARGCAVRALDDLSVGTEENLAGALAAGAELQVGSILEPSDVRTALDGIEVVFHLACSNLRTSLPHPRLSHDVNGGGTLTVLEAVAAEAPELERFVHCSSSEAYGTALVAPMSEEHATAPTTVYGASKLAADWYALAFRETHGIPVTVARPFNTYGPREHVLGTSGEVIPKMVLRALNGEAPVIFGDGEQARDFTYVTDTVAGLIAVGEADGLLGEVVNIARGEEVTIGRIAELVCGLCAPGLEPVHAPPRPADVKRHYADTTKARERAGFEAKVGIEEGLPRFVEWFRTAYADPASILAREVERNWETVAGA